jgi:hypothetical protein
MFNEPHGIEAGYMIGSNRIFTGMASVSARWNRMIFHDGGWDLSVGGKPMTPGPVAAALCSALECYPGLTDLPARIADLDIEGVEKELIFPQRLFGLMMFGVFLIGVPLIILAAISKSLVLLGAAVLLVVLAALALGVISSTQTRFLHKRGATLDVPCAFASCEARLAYIPAV